MTTTDSMENYLRVIYEVQLERDIVRIKDIIKRLKVSTPSAVEAVRKLAEKGFVIHEKRSYIKLTQSGIIEAQKIYQNHKVLFRFFKEILNMTEEESEHFSCVMEHHVNEQHVEKIKAFIEFFNKNRQILHDFHKFWEEVAKMKITLDTITPGESVKVAKIEGDPSIKSRLLNMGILPGTTLKIERVAPLGDPIEVMVKGYRLSLRKKEAKSVIVEKE
ncbi:MAG: DtxR family transcriptional regulator [Thermotogaceae bacterium]|nr:DtxR family transcriptional regulator [Thermotogaceae bacterium]